jgi:hypothetical protein
MYSIDGYSKRLKLDNLRIKTINLYNNALGWQGKDNSLYTSYMAQYEEAKEEYINYENSIGGKPFIYEELQFLQELFHQPIIIN